MTDAKQHFTDLGAEMEAAPGSELRFLHLGVIGEHQTIVTDMRRTTSDALTVHQSEVCRATPGSAAPISVTRQAGIVDIKAASRLWRQDGFVVLPGYLKGDLLDEAAADLAEVYPTAEAYHTKPLAAANQAFNGDEFGGVIGFPFPSLALCNLVTCEPILELAEAIFQTAEIRIYASELWAKYTGATHYEQEHHRDYLNHTPLVPSGEYLWRGLEIFIWLCDVPRSLGPTHIAPMSLTADLPALPHVQTPSQSPELYEGEVSTSGRAGTVVAYSTDTFHRGTELTEPRGARFSAHVSYRHGDTPWLSRHAWGDRSFDANWAPFVEQATPRQLAAFGFPPPGHPYWTAETLRGMALRYPGLDLSSWADAL